jgi:hypothetical protein
MKTVFIAGSIVMSFISAPIFADISGHVADTATHASIANVKVTVIGTGTSAITDAQGNFTIITMSVSNQPDRAQSEFGLNPVIHDNKLSMRNGEKILSFSIVNTRGSGLFQQSTADGSGLTSLVLPPFPQGRYELSIVGENHTWIFRLMRLDGRFFILSDMKQPPSPSSALRKTDATATFAVACENAAYKTRELNVTDSGVNEIRLVPVLSTTYYYFPPVQLGDGIVTGKLSDFSANQTLMQMMGTRVLTKNGNHEIHSILVCRDNKLIFEEYFYGNSDTINFENNIARVTCPNVQWTRTMKHYVASTTKAMTSTVVGIALNKMGLTTDEKISKYLPAYSAMFTGQKTNLTIKHCLNMVSGFDWNEWGGPDLGNMWKTTDFTQFVLNHNIRSTPGTEWVYISGLPNIEHRIVQNMVGDSAVKFIRQNLLEPLGITDINWERQPGGELPEGGARIFIRPRDMMKWGLTCLNGGKWQNIQVIPAEWLTTCRQAQVNGNYSYHFWVKDYTYGTKTVSQFSAEGDGGNYVCIFPTLNMVVVFTGGLYLESPTYDNQIKDMLTNYILPAIAP